MLVVLAIVAGFLLRGTYMVIQKDVASNQYVDSLKAKQAALVDHEAELKASISRLKTDDGIDQEIKDKFSVALPGEHVAVIVDPKVPTSSASTTSNHWYTSLWRSIKNLLP